MLIDLSPELASRFEGDDAYDAIANLGGELIHAHKRGKTFRVQLGDRRYFIKYHGTTAWREILKNWFRFRLPVLTAKTEVDAISELERLNIRTVKAAGLGIRGMAPAGLTSFIITEALEDFVHLDEVAATWESLPPQERYRLRRTAAQEIAAVGRAMHAHHLNHRDFYLCHFMLADREWSATSDQPLELHVIDLHRMQKRMYMPSRWAVKDLASTFHSALNQPMTTGEAIRFMQWYFDAPVRQWTSAQRRFVKRVMRRTIWLYTRVHKTPPPFPKRIAGLV